MSIRLALLKTGEHVIADIKELVKEDPKSGEEGIYGYLFTNPHKLTIERPVIIVEEPLVENNNNSKDSSIDVVFSPWIILTEDKEILVSLDWVVTLVQPLESVVKLFKEKVNA